MKYNIKLDLIKDKKIIIGVDIAKHVHYASTIDKSTGMIIKSGIQIHNNKNGFETFFNLIKKWQTNDVIIGMEPTGHYWKVFNNCLRK